jgi:hypothetical protein
LSRPVQIGALALRDIEQARDWFNSRDPGLGDTFLDSVNETVQRIAANRSSIKSSCSTSDKRPSRRSVTASGITWPRIPVSWSPVSATGAISR